jgi:hypothetical protein
MKKIISSIFLIVLIISCNQTDVNKLTAQQIVDKAIETSHKNKLLYSNLNFKFRDAVYDSEGHCDHFVLRRITTNDDEKILDIFQPGLGLKRYVNDSLNIIADTTANKYAETINSVFYFTQLPYRLNDDAVNKKYLKLDTIKGKSYHNIQVTFNENGGGEDFQDVYYYWFNTENFKLDYLAYSFVVNGGGVRFREAYNERIIEGIRFVDYKNYKPKSDMITIDKILKVFKNNELELLSEIKNENIKLTVDEDKC